MKAAHIPKEETYVIESILANTLSVNFLEIGIHPGKEIRLLHQAPAGGPLAFLIGESIIALRRKEAELIEVRNL